MCMWMLLWELTSSVTRGTVKAVPLFLLSFRAWSVFSLTTHTHTHINAEAYSTAL